MPATGYREMGGVPAIVYNSVGGTPIIVYIDMGRMPATAYTEVGGMPATVYTEVVCLLRLQMLRAAAIQRTTFTVHHQVSREKGRNLCSIWSRSLTHI